MARRIGKLSATEQAKLEKMYTSGPAAYGSARNLQATSKMPKAKIDTFLQQKDAHTKYRQIQRKFPRLKVIAYEINEIWSIDVAYVDKLPKYNNGVKYLLVAVDVLSRFLRVVPMRSKSAPDAAKAFEKMIEKVQPPPTSSLFGHRYSSWRWSRRSFLYNGQSHDCIVPQVRRILPWHW